MKILPASFLAVAALFLVLSAQCADAGRKVQPSDTFSSGHTTEEAAAAAAATATATPSTSTPSGQDTEDKGTLSTAKAWMKKSKDKMNEAWKSVTASLSSDDSSNKASDSPPPSTTTATTTATTATTTTATTSTSTATSSTPSSPATSEKKSGKRAPSSSTFAAGDGSASDATRAPLTEEENQHLRRWVALALVVIAAGFCTVLVSMVRRPPSVTPGTAIERLEEKVYALYAEAGYASLAEILADKSPNTFEGLEKLILLARELEDAASKAKFPEDKQSEKATAAERYKSAAVSIKSHAVELACSVGAKDLLTKLAEALFRETEQDLNALCQSKICELKAAESAPKIVEITEENQTQVREWLEGVDDAALHSDAVELATKKCITFYERNWTTQVKSLKEGMHALQSAAPKDSEKMELVSGLLVKANTITKDNWEGSRESAAHFAGELALQLQRQHHDMNMKVVEAWFRSYANLEKFEQKRDLQAKKHKEQRRRDEAVRAAAIQAEKRQRDDAERNAQDNAKARCVDFFTRAKENDIGFLRSVLVKVYLICGLIAVILFWDNSTSLQTCDRTSEPNSMWSSWDPRYFSWLIKDSLCVLQNKLVWAWSYVLVALLLVVFFVLHAIPIVGKKAAYTFAFYIVCMFIHESVADAMKAFYFPLIPLVIHAILETVVRYTIDKRKAKLVDRPHRDYVLDESCLGWFVKDFDCRPLVLYNIVPIVCVIVAVECISLFCVNEELLAHYHLY